MISVPAIVASSRPSSIQMTVAPTSYPVELEDVKRHLRIDHNEEDSLIQAYIGAATEYCQEYTWSQLITATFVERRDYFPPSISPIQLQKNPNVSVSSIQYIDTGGTTQTLDSSLYVIDPYIKPALIVPAYTKFWPTTRWHVNDVIVTYTAGYGADSTTVPQEIKLALILKVAQFYWARGDTGASNQSDITIKSLLDLKSFRTFY